MSEKQENVNNQFANPYQAYPYYYYPQSSPAYYPMYNTRQQFPPQTQQQNQQAPVANDQNMLPIQESYIENILRLNRGKQATVYMTFENNDQWNAQIFKGVIEAAGRDHIIISDPQTGKRYLLLMIYLDYVTFDEEINYSYPYGSNSQMSMYSPR
ncbi:spore coat protein GerQ [Virgibacillus profundi]|uniref:Spore coat protein GerQ n=1 Tax=Virgibacillus profundi TaxID=2024555 RepID=A0A2A2IJX3_9BACI|nr:spore coat protein GerQ [Virgibacillus profundi]PAV31413.1 spore coat protein GerQ [Virgibacillus profundi]PXY55599.1 spore coat protein GerQ [Virgibacillus profundi]